MMNPFLSAIQKSETVRVGQVSKCFKLLTRDKAKIKKVNKFFGYM